MALEFDISGADHQGRDCGVVPALYGDADVASLLSFLVQDETERTRAPAAHEQSPVGATAAR
ncbi:hypothetical protein [Streptomyces sp. NPDC060322]|uniref:hypothetical protein n=1 Tax=Streptomyces sp. NPDC060322 TaxID=3347097 RepID=UPI003650E5DD